MPPLGAIFSGLEARRASAKNRAFQKKMYKHRFRYSVKDMRKAGINPILAAGAGLGGGGSPSGSVVMGGDPDTGISSAVKLSQEGALQNKQRALLVAQTTSAGELARKTAAEATAVEAGLPKANLIRELYASPYGKALVLANEFGGTAATLGLGWMMRGAGKGMGKRFSGRGKHTRTLPGQGVLKKSKQKAPFYKPETNPSRYLSRPNPNAPAWAKGRDRFLRKW